MTAAERVKTYGKPATSVLVTDPATGQKKLKLVPSVEWERKNIVMVHVPWPLEHSRYGFQRPIRVHKLVVDQFSLMFRRWKESGLLEHLKTMDGTLNIRMKRGKEASLDISNLSTHSFGAAIDLNARWNGLGKKPAPVGSEGSLIELVPIAQELGFVWGGEWKTPDAMHLEIGKVLKPAGKA